MIVFCMSIVANLKKTAKFVAFQYMTYLYILNQHLLNQLDQISTYEGVL